MGLSPTTVIRQSDIQHYTCSNKMLNTNEKAKYDLKNLTLIGLR